MMVALEQMSEHSPSMGTALIGRTKKLQVFARDNGFWEAKEGYAAGTDDTNNRYSLMVASWLQACDLCARN